MHLKLISIERIDTNIQNDLLIHSDSNGVAIVIKQIGLCNDEGVIVRTCTINDEMIKLLKQNKIEI